MGDVSLHAMTIDRNKMELVMNTQRAGVGS